MTNKKKQMDEEIEYVEDEEYGSSPEMKNKTKRLGDQLKQCKKERHEYLEGWQRAKADLINSRKDADEKIAGAHQWGKENLITEVLLVLDNFDFALLNEPGQDEWAREGVKWARGVERIMDQLLSILSSNGIERIQVKEDDVFNPEEHHAIETREVSDKIDGVILEVVKWGYKTKDGRILRPAEVIVNALATNKSNS